MDEDDVSDVEFEIEDEDEDMVDDDSEMETDDDDEEESAIGEVHPHVTAQLIMRLQQCKHSPIYTHLNGLPVDVQLFVMQDNDLSL